MTHKVQHARIDKDLEGNVTLWFKDTDGKLLHNYLEKPPDYVVELFLEDPHLIVAALDGWHPFKEGSGPDEAF